MINYSKFCQYVAKCFPLLPQVPWHLHFLLAQKGRDFIPSPCNEIPHAGCRPTVVAPSRSGKISTPERRGSSATFTFLLAGVEIRDPSSRRYVFLKRNLVEVEVRNNIRAMCVIQLNLLRRAEQPAESQGHQNKFREACLEVVISKTNYIADLPSC